MSFIFIKGLHGTACANIKQFEMEITNDIRTLKNQFKAWKDNYLLTSPIGGKVTLTKFWIKKF